jgi:hypothetical protein
MTIVTLMALTTGLLQIFGRAGIRCDMAAPRAMRRRRESALAVPAFRKRDASKLPGRFPARSGDGRAVDRMVEPAGGATRASRRRRSGDNP